MRSSSTGTEPAMQTRLAPALLQSHSGSVCAVRQERTRILVVDDEMVTRMRLRRLLESNGYIVDEAENGREALTRIYAESFDLILMDISMPLMDGFWALRMIRQRFTQGDLPVVMMTSSDDREQVIESFDRGANDYVAKPIDAAVSIARIKNQVLIKESQRKLRASEERYALTAKGTNDGMWDWCLLTGDLYLSPRYREMVGRHEEEWHPSGAEWMDLIHDEDRKRAVRDLEAHLCGETSHFETELRMRDSDNSFRWMLCRGLAVRDNNGIAARIAGSLTDITEGKVADALTGLPNRTLFRERVKRCVSQLASGSKRSFAVMYMDVDDFKLINDNYGHDAGDEFLIALAKRLENTLRDSDAILARLGGDEFGILIEEIRTENDAVSIAKRLEEKMAAPFTVANRELLTRGSIGIAIGARGEDQECPTAEELLSRADTAMYHAKHKTENKYSVFLDSMHAENALRLELGGDLRTAIARDELDVHYQPIVSLEAGEVAGFEALVRWTHPEHGNVRPDIFIPVAESNGLVVEIGKWVLYNACRKAAEWQAEHQKRVMISVNVSIVQLSTQDFAQTVADVLEETGLSPELLKLEVTESLLMQNPENTIEILRRIQEMGVTLSIDDFGTGYSSLSYLHQMPLNVLKVDRSFVSRMNESHKHLAIVRSIIALANSLELEVIAEGVETPEQLQRLQQLGCNMVQGYLIDRPRPAEEAGQILTQFDFRQYMPTQEHTDEGTPYAAL